MRARPDICVRRARTADVPDIADLVQTYAEQRILLAKERITLYEAVQEFHRVYPNLQSTQFDESDLDLREALAGAGFLDESAGAAQAVRNPSDRAEALALVAAALARTDPAAAARLAQEAGASAIATSSAAVAWCHGYADREYIPTETALSAVREIVRGAKADNYRFSAIILGIVNSLPMRMRQSL